MTARNKNTGDRSQLEFTRTQIAIIGAVFLLLGSENSAVQQLGSYLTGIRSPVTSLDDIRATGEQNKKDIAEIKSTLSRIESRMRDRRAALNSELN